ncbi:MAG: IS1595 family transposase, partial [SAR324 cluster bacterium]|nr:IS1595 family transposase [SAR324 cluster bacterium]
MLCNADRTVRFACTAVLLAVLGLAARAEPVPAAERGVVMGRNGMAASIHPLASKVGIDVLQGGGNAVDAAVAMAAMLNVADAPMTGIGGDAFALIYWAREGRVVGLNASGRSPYGATREFFVREGYDAVPPLSIHAVNVPGALDGWVTMLERYGTRPLAELLAPAIGYAEEGIPVNETLLGWYRVPLADPLAIETYYFDGRKPRLGQVLVQKNLAESLRKIAQGGRDAFYRGPIAREIVRFSKSKGGFLSMRDFADHRSDWVEPIAATYRGLEVIGFPPNTQGIALLEQLNILEGFDLAALGHNSTDTIHLMIEGKKGTSANQIKRTLGITYKTAWHLCHRIREAMGTDDFEPVLFGIIEVDETMIRGPRRYPVHGKGRGRGVPADERIWIAGALQRDGQVRLKRVPNVRRDTLHRFIKEHVKDEAEAIYTDALRSYIGIA